MLWNSRSREPIYISSLVFCGGWRDLSRCCSNQVAGDADRPALGPLVLRGYIGGFVAILSLGPYVGRTPESRRSRHCRTSVVFAALIGWLIPKEKVGPRRIMLMCLIALGAVIVELGG